MTENKLHDRTRYQIETDIACSIRTHLLHVAFYRRLRTILTTATLFAGTVAFATVFEGVDPLLRVAGGVVALLSILSHTLDPATKQALHEQVRRRFADLYARRFDLDDVALETELRKIEVEEPPNVRALEKKGQNYEMLSRGHEDRVRKLTVGERLTAAIV